MSYDSLIPFLHVTPPRYDDVLHLTEAHEISNGCENVREIVQDSTTQTTGLAASGTTTSWDFRCSDDMCIDRTILIRQEVGITVTAAADNTDFVELSGITLAAFPLSRCMQSISVSINGGAGKVYRPNQTAPALRRYMDDKELQKMNGLCPTQLDPFNSLAALQLIGGCGTAADTEGTGAASPLATAARVSEGNGPFAKGTASSEYEPRSSFRRKNDVFTAKGATSKASHVITWEVTEALPHQFFDWLATEDRTLSRINNINITIQWGNLNSLFVIGNALVTSGAPAAAVVTNNGFTKTVAQLLVRQSKPVMSIPPVVKFDYEDVVVYPTIIAKALATYGHDPEPVNVQSIQVSQVPERILIYAQRSNITTLTKPDGFLSISNLSIDTDTSNNGLGNASEQQLYQMSARNGYRGTFSDFAYNSGSVVCCDIRKGDIAGLVAGMMTPTRFNIRCTVNNRQTISTFNRTWPVLSGATEDVNANDWTLYVVMFMKGKLILDGTTGALEGGDHQSTVETVMKSLEPVPEGGGVRGGSIRSFFRSMYRKVIRPVGHFLGREFKNELHAAKGMVLGAVHSIAGKGLSALGSVLPHENPALARLNAAPVHGSGVKRMGYTGSGVRLS